MRRRVFGALALTAMIAMATAAQAAAGLKMTYTGDDGGPTQLFAEGGKLGQNDGSSGMFIDCKVGRITMWDGDNNVYWQGPASDVISYTRDMFAEMQKEMAAYQTQAPRGGKAQVTSLGTRTIAGYNAIGYKVSGDGPLGASTVETWFSAALQKQIERETGRCDAFTAFLGLSALSAGVDLTEATGQLQSAHGYVVSQTINVGGESTLLTELQKVEQVDIPASTLALPSGLSRAASYKDYLVKIGADQ